MFRVYTVSNVSADPRSVIVSDGLADRPIPCLASYDERAAGDQVVAVRLDGGSWLVLGKIGADPTTLASITYGNGDPAGGGWRSSDALWLRDEGQGRRSLYVDTGSAIPFPATVSASSAAGWLTDLTGGSDFPRSGAVSATQADWFGAWFYQDLPTAVAAGLVTGMTVQVSRTVAGTNGPVPLFLGLHTATPGQVPTITAKWTPGVSLSPGGTAVIPIPAAQRALLGGYTSGGIAVYGSGAQWFAEYQQDADIVITYG